MPKLKILIAEDSKSMQFFYRKALPDMLFDKHIAGDGKEALEQYQALQPDIILLDMNMPEMNGYQTLKAIRETFKDLQTTIIMVTSASEKEDVVACAKLGIQGYIVKPFTEEELPQLVMKCHKTRK